MLFTCLIKLEICFIHCRPEVIECLSGEVRKAVVGDNDHKISEECRKQLRVEKLRQVRMLAFLRPSPPHPTPLSPLSSIITSIISSNVPLVIYYCNVFSFRLKISSLIQSYMVCVKTMSNGCVSTCIRMARQR
jgi:hypothetical protein